MQSVSSKPVQTFAIGYHEPRYNEAEHAKAIARHLRTDHTELYVTPDDCLEVVPQLPTLYDEPFADYSQIPTFLVSRLARSKVTVALSGDGGDELFGGYNDYAKNLRDWQRQLTVWRHCPPAVRRGMAGLLTELGQSGRRVLGIDDPAERRPARCAPGSPGSSASWRSAASASCRSTAVPRCTPGCGRASSGPSSWCSAPGRCRAASPTRVAGPASPTRCSA